MSALPAWASSPEARALLAAIRIEQPEYVSLRRYAWTSTREPKYKGANARALRNLWEAARDAAMDANDRPLWIALGEQHPDDLIAALLNEQTVPFSPMEWTERDDGSARVAA